MRGPTNRNQTSNCPDSRGSLGEIPNGLTTCSSNFNDVSAPTEWQAGDIIIARAPATFATDIPFELRTGGVYTCSVTFQGWSGPCTGKTGLVPGNVYETSIT